MRHSWSSVLTNWLKSSGPIQAGQRANRKLFGARSPLLGSLVRICICSRFVSISETCAQWRPELMGATFPAFHPYASRAVEIENNTGRNFKDLEEMLGNSKALKRNKRECKGILIDPLKAPRFSRC